MYPKHSFTLSSIALSLLLASCGGSSSYSTADSSTATSTEEDTAIVAVVSESTSETLVINEVVAAAENDGNDWIEFYAVTDIADLSTYSVVDDNETREAQFLPAIAMSAGDFVVVQAIDEEDEAPTDTYYVTFKLGSDDAVTLYQDSVEIHQLDWEEGEATQGYSYGLYIDGTGSAQTMLPTVGAANEALIEDVEITDTIINNDALLRINEVVAKDANGDEDWIEFYATGDEAVYLGDYTVTDEDGELYVLPDVTIGAGEFYRVYATNDEIEGAETVGFKLGSSDQVSLFLASDLIDQFSWKKGEALIGTSYGRFPDGSDRLTTLTPTAVSSNVLTTHGPLVINEVVATQDDDSNDWFELYNNGDADISLSDYQIIDSSDDIDPVTLPGITLTAGNYAVIAATDEDPGTDYVPFKLGKEDELTLTLNDETVDYLSWQDSDVSAGYSYGLASDGSWETNTLAVTKGTANELPEVYAHDEVESIYFEIDEDEWQDLLDNASDEEYHLTQVTYQGVILEEVAIRAKGNSSLNAIVQSGGERFSFNIDVNEYVDGQKLLGMKKFVLNNMYNDPSYMREYIAYDLLYEMGVATPQNSYVNDELKGLYLLVEFINGDFIEQHFDNGEGDLYKPDGVGSDLVWIDDDFASYSEVELKTNEDTSDNSAFIRFVYEMAFGDGESVIDHDSVLRYMSVSVALSNLDSYHGSLDHNYYIYEQDNVFSMLPWDLNESFGSFNQSCNRVDIRELYIDEPTAGALVDKPLIAEVFANSDNLATYHGYLTELIEGSLSSDAFAARVQSISNLIDEHVENDPTAFYTYNEFLQNQTSTVDRFYGLTSFVDYRVENMSQQLSGEIASSGNGNGFCN